MFDSVIVIEIKFEYKQYRICLINVKVEDSDCILFY
jgi:hypothetical protein